MALGSIVVRLTMNTADFDTDAGRAAKIAQKRAAEIDKSFKAAGVAIGLALSAAAIGITKAVGDSIDRMDDLSKASQKVGLPTEQFSQLEYAAKLADVEMDTLVTSLGKLTKSEAASLNSTSQQAKVFEALGISVQDASGNLRNSGEVLLDFADKFKSLQGSPEAMAAGFALFGRSFQDLIPLLKDGGDGIRDLMKEADDLGQTVSTSAGQAAEQFNDDLTRLKSSLQGAATEIATGMLPGLLDMSGGLVASAKDMQDLREFGESLAATLGFVVEVAGRVGKTFRHLGVDAASSVEGVSALYEVMSQFSTLGLADGSIKEGVARLKANGQSTIQAHRDIEHPAVTSADRIAAAAANLAAAKARLHYVDYNGPGLTGTSIKPIDAGRLRSAVGNIPTKTGGGGGGAHKAQLTDEQKAAQQLGEEYKRLTETMNERIGLFGKESEVAKVTYDIEHGSLQKLTQAQKDSLLAEAASLDKLKEENDVKQEATRLTESLLTPTERINKERERANELLQKGAISQADYNKVLTESLTPTEQVLKDLEYQTALLGQTADAQDRLALAHQLGSEALTANGQAALGALANYQELKNSMEDAAAAGQAVGQDFADAFGSLLDGTKTAKEAFKDFADAVIRDLFRIWIQRKLTDAATAGGGSSAGGGFWASVLGAIGSSGGREHGGMVEPGKVYQVGESNAPEMFMSRGRQYMIPGDAGNVRPLGGRGGTTINNQFLMPSMVTRQTQEQVAQRMAVAGKRADSRNR